MPRTSEAIVQALKEAGITTIFGIPSIHNIGLYDAIRRDGSFRHIVCRHEAAATHMADGYARASGSTRGDDLLNRAGGRVYALGATRSLGQLLTGVDDDVEH